MKQTGRLWKKMWLCLLTGVLAFEVFLFGSEARVLAAGIVNEEFMLSSGVSYKEVRLDQEPVKQALRVMEVNLSDPNTRVEMVIPNPLNKLSRTTSQANANNYEKHYVVGAINASFFNQVGDKLPMYLLAENNLLKNVGIIASGDDQYVNQPIAFGINKDGKAMIDEFNLDMTVTVDGQTFKIDSINKQRSYDNLILYTPSYPGMVTKTNESGSEVTIRNLSEPLMMAFGQTVTGTVEDIRRYGVKESTKIPQDGFVISGHGKSLEAIQKMQEGKTIQLSINIDQKWHGVQTMLGSGPILVKDGRRNLGMNPTSSRAREKAPRTAVAIDKTGTKVFFVTVDGRQEGYSKGMNLVEFADYLVSLGADRALNLDGGGSTAMAIRYPGETVLRLANQPSDGSERSVSATLQAISTIFPTPPKVPVPIGAKAVVLDSFERIGSWQASAIRSSASIASTTSNDPVYHGGAALKLSYDMTTGGTGTAAAYLNAKLPVVMDGIPKAIGVWIFGDGSAHWLRGKIVDGKGEEHLINFTNERGLTWEGWKYVEASIPSELPKPLMIKQIYLTEPYEELKNKGTVFVDKLQAIYSNDYQELPYKDVSVSMSGFNELKLLAQSEVVSGYPDGSFRPYETLNRVQAAILLAKALDLDTSKVTNPGFKDIPESYRFYKEIAAVAQAGIMNGKKGKVFDPNSKLTRAEMAIILKEAFDLKDSNQNQFPDNPSNGFAFKAINSLALSGITTGYDDGTFRPGNPLKRIEYSIFLYRGLEKRNK